jgi:hypothetical protein
MSWPDGMRYLVLMVKRAMVGDDVWNRRDGFVVKRWARIWESLDSAVVFNACMLRRLVVVVGDGGDESWWKLDGHKRG